MYRAIGRAVGLLVALLSVHGAAWATQYIPVPTCQSVGGVNCAVDNGGDNWTSYYCATQPHDGCYALQPPFDNYGWYAGVVAGAPAHKGLLIATGWNGYTSNSPEKVYFQADTCSATDGKPITGTVARSGEPSASNPPPQEVCHESCLYALSSAVAATGLDGSELWSGTWVGTGQSCPGTPPPSPDENGDTLEGNLTNDATRASDAAESAYSSFLDQLRADSIAQRSAPSGQSPIGSFWAIPSVLLGAVDRSPTNCDLEIDLSGSESLGFMSGAISSTDVCRVQEFADTFGNWFIWFCAVLWSWAIVMRGGTPE